MKQAVYTHKRWVGNVLHGPLATTAHHIASGLLAEGWGWSTRAALWGALQSLRKPGRELLSSMLLLLCLRPVLRTENTSPTGFDHEKLELSTTTINSRPTGSGILASRKLYKSIPAT